MGGVSIYLAWQGLKDLNTRVSKIPVSKNSFPLKNGGKTFLAYLFLLKQSYWQFSYFFAKAYITNSHLKFLSEANLISTNIYFC